MDKILLIDGMNALYRASVSFGPPKIQHQYCTDCDKFISLHQLGQPHCICGGAWFMLEDKCEKSSNEDYVIVYNFFRSLRATIEKFNPDKCFFVLEGHPQFRYDLFTDYKANRLVKTASKQSAREKVFKCKDEVVKLLQYLPITICKADAFEADDVIATLCEGMRDEELIVLSNDSDYIQLLQRGYKNCQVFNPIKKEYMQAPVYPYVAWKCLAGDKADNIPSLLKPKKVELAMKDPEVLRQFLSIEENRSNFSINKQLIEFRSVPEDDIIFVEGFQNFDQLKKEFIRMEFESIINDLSWEKFKSTFDCLKY